MRNGYRTTNARNRGARDRNTTGYLLSEDALLALSQTRDELRLLARLAEPAGQADDIELSLSPMALAHCFDRLAVELDRVIEAAHWQRPSR